MTLLTDVIIFALSIFVLSKSANTVIKSSVKIARITKLGELTIGFLVLSIATTIPELAVSSSAIISGDVGISLGNILGSSVTNICLLIGLIGLLHPMRIAEKTLMKLIEILSLSSLILIILLVTNSLSKPIGIALLIVYLLFGLYSVKKKITLGDIRFDKTLNLINKFKFSSGFYKSIFFLIIGLILVLFSSWYVVNSASNIAMSLGVAKSVIGATIIAVGTSLPELSTAVAASKEGHLKLGLGNIIGACLTNLTLVLGLILVLSPLTIAIDIFITLVGFVLISNVLLLIFIGSIGRKKLERFEGAILLIVYIIFLILTFSATIPGLGLFSLILK